MNLSLFFEEGLLGLLVCERHGEVDGLIEGDLLSLRTAFSRFCDVFLIISFPLYEKEAGEFDVGGGLFEMGLKSDVIQFSIDSSIHMGWL